MVCLHNLPIIRLLERRPFQLILCLHRRVMSFERQPTCTIAGQGQVLSSIGEDRIEFWCVMELMDLPPQERALTLITPVQTSESEDLYSKSLEGNGKSSAIGWSSFLFALFQSICGAVVAINGLRLAIGIGSLALTTGAGAVMVRFHADWIRLPMLAIALVGSLLNLAILLHVRHLRSRPASQWRQKPLSRHKLRMERVQFVLSVATLLLIGIEEYLHFGFHHKI
jgi:hypothetical protein